ncbi:MAG TPA: NAD-dependent epimerase/dehydratase family protein [Stellaceae bacterium]|nr:NAD-dependent epimerase/dehydratase family protein [Stellaceae bacterium]
MARILVTGAAGFIGRALCRGLAARGHQVVGAVRRAGGPPIDGAARCALGDFAPETDWAPALAGVEIVIHLAQRAHRRADAAILAREPAAAAALARAAASAGARRLVYMSSIKASGEFTAPGDKFRPDDPPRPEDAYGRTKLATERALAAVAAETGVELATIRPPLVYGPGVGGNFRSLLRLVDSGLPLPFAAVDNRRSLVAVDNLVDFVARAAVHPAAAGRILFARDASDLSTPALIRALASGLARPARLFAVPQAVFALGRKLPGLGPALARLTLSARLDDAATRAALGWAPPVAAETALALTARAFRAAG